MTRILSILVVVALLGAGLVGCKGKDPAETAAPKMEGFAPPTAQRLQNKPKLPPLGGPNAGKGQGDGGIL